MPLLSNLGKHLCHFDRHWIGILVAMQLQQVVDKTIIYADTDGDGKVSFEEFKAVVGGTPGLMENSMALQDV